MPKKSAFTKRYALLRSLLIGARQQRKLTQRDLAKAAGRVPSFIANVETGERRLDVVEFIDYCQLLSVDPFDLMKQAAETTEPSLFLPQRSRRKS